MSVRNYLHSIRKHWLWVVIPTIVVTVAVGILSMEAPRVYRSTATLYVSLNSGRTVTDLNQGSSYAQTQMASFGRMATMPIVLQPVIASLGLGMSVKDLGNQVSATTPASQFMIDVSASSGSAEMAQKIANSVAGQLSSVIEEVSPATTEGDSTVQATVVSQAALPLYPIAPNTKRNVAAAAFAALVLGLLGAVVRDLLDTRVRTKEDVDATANVPVLGRVSGPRSRRRRSGEVRVLQPDGPQSEDIRRIRANLQMVGRVGEPQAFVFTSAMPGEGKSYCATHVAESLAAAGTKVLLIDADLRRPTVAAYLGIGGRAGLTEYLLGRAEFEDLRQEYGPNLSVLASGGIPPNPAELLSSAPFHTLLEMACEQFDVVILDTPPLLPVADAAVVARAATGVVLVVDSTRTRRAQLSQSAEAVRLGGGRLVGAVLNRTAGDTVTSYHYEYTGVHGAPIPTTGEVPVVRAAHRDHREVQPVRLVQPQASDETKELPIVGSVRSER
jgi:capsular exopolysaccharide synthesis family protein